MASDKNVETKVSSLRLGMSSYRSGSLEAESTCAVSNLKLSISTVMS